MKQAIGDRLQARGIEFRARAGAAPLKLVDTEAGADFQKLIPRPRGRGPVEAEPDLG